MRETVNSVRVRAHTHCSVPEMPLLPLCPASWYIVLCSSPAAVRGTRKCKSRLGNARLHTLIFFETAIVFMSTFPSSSVELRINKRTKGSAIQTSSKSHPWDIYGTCTCISVLMELNATVRPLYAVCCAGSGRRKLITCTCT